MSGRCVAESEFAARFRYCLDVGGAKRAQFVTGPGRSGAVAAVYASHLMGLAFLPYGQFPTAGARVLIVDTAIYTGATVRKAMRRYKAHDAFLIVAYQEPPRVSFWYEACNVRGRDEQPRE